VLEKGCSLPCVAVQTHQASSRTTSEIENFYITALMKGIQDPKTPSMDSPSNKDEAFTSTLLNLDDDEIRLVVLNPRDIVTNTSYMLSCELKVVKLRDAPEYETLSYVWGPHGPVAQL
jgi:hypothetical protein